MNYDLLLSDIKKTIPFEITDDELICLAIDVSRSSDNKITKAINDFKNEHNLKVTSNQKKQIRDYIIGKADWKLHGILPIEKERLLVEDDINKALIILSDGIRRNSTKVFGTLKSRLNKKRNNLSENITKYEEIFLNLEKNHNQLLIIHVNPEDNLFVKIMSVVLSEYDNLSNYHNLAIVFEDSKFNKISWSTISKISTSLEYIKNEDHFGAFNRQKTKKIKELTDFISNNENISYNDEIKSQIEEFYSSQSFGFQFCDLFISKTNDTKILIMQKIKLDETPYPCPDCMETVVRGNSYPKLLQKSFECQNANCPSRSKIGRGKRYDLLGVKRNLMLELNDKSNIVPADFAKKFRRDVFDADNYVEMLMRFYSWSGSQVLIIKNFSSIYEPIDYLGRKIMYKNVNDYKRLDLPESVFDKLFSTIIKYIEVKPSRPQKTIASELYSVYNGDSSKILPTIPEKITGAITSPPYYNAREYSQWPTLLCYLIDMAINAKEVFSKLENDSYYFYNIGDIVGQDNVYISSHMSKRRLMLGFYSVSFFEKIGYNFIDNIIWDKGEVQSKRNSTENLFPGYIKPINCYEHILIFGKKINDITLENGILTLDPVRKINSKGENILGHTAPYPEKLVNIIFPFLSKSGYLLDPFLGSGTTIIASYKELVKSVGIELDVEYYTLAVKRIQDSIDSNQLMFSK